MLRTFVGDMETMLEDVEKVEACEVPEAEVHALDVELRVLKDQEVTIERLRLQLAEAEASATRHAEQDPRGDGGWVPYSFGWRAAGEVRATARAQWGRGNTGFVKPCAGITLLHRGGGNLTKPRCGTAGN
ncbi:hypothetical protein TraAM80_09416 [Trypanosoma rangeli]|uniref:Uncharacterized protein n=1 Tax=Trypanosoma rangeli TaxID=5698 RepID=A0A3R7M0P1_TRYRA|nr:uncharacterized protein TraAM80_09416 [Trypanosoma rangeli]RNE97235.1 hypothetical protein TraAM80_09416 [Trypanosoma rangeli]|eukprot:RNE97235.1 hypothetical protein TraAM80_09416 [Trypanosoma rangeli]